MTVDREDTLAEPVIDLGTGVLVEDRGEVTAHDLLVRRIDHAEPARHPAEPPAARIDALVIKRVGFDRAAAVEEAHLRDHLECRAADIDRVTAGANGRRTLDERDRVPGTGEPVAECGTCDAGAGDEDLHAYDVRMDLFSVDSCPEGVLEQRT